MDSLDVESLFSLEIIVDKLQLPNIQCRFPAIAFRLLDFPTLMIYHVEPELGETIKTKIRMDPLYKLGKQIPELVDKDGCFSIKKGKSCLMKMSPNTLLSHLSSTPLYVMVIDTFPETPKLIGNCTLPLDETMKRVYQDVCKVGLAVPTVGGEKGCYKIFNLMGVEIGSLLLGIRILSLGVGLIPHIPASSISKSSKTEVKLQPNQSRMDEIQEQVADIVLEDFEKEDAKTTAAIQFLQPGLEEPRYKKDKPKKTVQIPTQTEREFIQNIATQTEKCTRQKRQKRALDIASQLEDNIVDDIIVTNTICPPPLHFNNDLEPKHSSHFDLLDRFAQVPANKDVSSDDDTLREEDISDDELTRERTPVSHHSRKPKTNKHALPSTSENMPQNIKDFPLLNAIVTEIAALTGSSQESSKQALIQISKPTRVPSVSPKRSRKPKDCQASPRRGRSPSPRRERESVDNFVKRMQSPTHTLRELPIVKPTYDTTRAPTPRKATHSHKCEKGHSGVPKHKSWLRKTPIPMEVKKTKLAFGLTNTQRLRLEKSNPELLKSLEKKESERVQRFKEQRKLEEEAKLQAVGPTRKLYDGTTVHSGFSVKHDDRRPVPTPRNSLHHTQETLFDEAHPLTTMQQVREQYRYQYNATPDIDVVAERETTVSEKSDQSLQKATPRTVDGQANPGNNFGRTKVIPPDQSFSVAQKTENQDDYVDDFEEVTDVTESRNVVPQRDVRQQPHVDNMGNISNESENIHVTALEPMEVLGLRQMNDNYSDDDASDSFKSAHSQSDHVEVKPFPAVLPNPVTKPKGPYQSAQKPMVAAKRPSHPLEKSNVTVEASVESTAYISRSQVFGNKSQDSDNSNIDTAAAAAKESVAKRPVASRVRRNTDSVSSYVGEDDTSPKSNTRNYSDDSFDDDDLDEYAVPDPLGMSDLQISKEAKMGYTWA